ncbi:MAG: hypothetical protein A3G59_03475 [Candidatus Taylorbacteria bacterium RIFCSPLOWO2_12_FULL_47_20]|uniref:Four helix bundle protein n=1 Tax=Candidatus Taylorbacteria bacterium RIFCSPLOWO2_12_FULL_47_20 TaxID=1802335 RepID=A0A1G2P5R1_9BACT|nr:MAG: hypothetical protein A3G59_03475 [Candidatus Taylorbacteria bacterium RIFCSPLOWO2_12_FULL_47_20]
MVETKRKILNFTDLIAYKSSHSLVLKVYEFSKKFPADERFALTNQIRRAAISITSNIAEGFSRQTSNDKSHFYCMAKGSLTELESQLLISKDLGYLNITDHSSLGDLLKDTARLISGLIRSANNR